MSDHFNFSVISLPNKDTMNFIREYNNFLKSLFIKNLKSFTTMGGFSDVVSADSLLKIELTDEVCTLINVIITELPCYNIYSGFVMTNLLLKLWSDQYLLKGNQNLSLALNEFREILDDSLDLMKDDKKDVDVSYLQSLVISLLMEEHSICLDKGSLHSFSLSVVKSVLSVTKTTSGLKFGLVGVYYLQGENKFSSMDGVLCEIDDVNSVLVFHQFSFPSIPGLYKLLMFSENLDVDDDSYFLHEITTIGVKLILCQKKISDSLKVALRRKKVIFIERTGEELAKSMQLLTNVIPISDYRNVNTYELPTMVGYFTNVSPVDDEKKNLILIENSEANVSYLYIRCRTFSDSTLVKKVVSKSVHLIKSVLSCPYFLPGPIEFEKAMIMFLKTNSKDKSDTAEEIVAIFMNILMEIINIYSNLNTLMVKKDSFLLKRSALLNAVDGITNILSLSFVIRKS